MDILFRFRITFLIIPRGLPTPCNLKKSPHALHRGSPAALRLQSGVMDVEQLVQMTGEVGIVELLEFVAVEVSSDFISVVILAVGLLEGVEVLGEVGLDCWCCCCCCEGVEKSGGGE